MAQYNDLFGFDRFMQAQNMARQWERQKEQDQRLIDQDAYTRRQDAYKNALLMQDAEEKKATQNAMRLGIENQPYLETLRNDPQLYNEAQAVNRQDMLRYNPRADVGTVAKFGDRMDMPKPEAASKGPKIENFGGVPYLVEGDKVRPAQGYKEPAKANNTPFKNERDLRREFTSLPEVKAYTEISSQYGRLAKAMEENAKGGSKLAVDQALITILNKMLDPTSVVRESEYARTPADTAFLNRMRGKIEKLKTGGAGITDEDRQALATMAERFHEVAKGMYGEQEAYYADLTNRYGYNPENVVRLGGQQGREKAATKQPAATAPKNATDYLKKWGM